jgi:hypothetical protein
MVQTSNKQSREADVEIRGSVKYYHSTDNQPHKGWYWCSDKKAFFRYTDWLKPMSDFI